MKKHLFYKKYANTPLEKRASTLSIEFDHPLAGMNLNDVYVEIHKIDDKIRADEIRREELLRAVEPFLK